MYVQIFKPFQRIFPSWIVFFLIFCQGELRKLPKTDWRSSWPIWNHHLGWGWGWGLSATPGLPNMGSRNRNQNLWNHTCMGDRSATPGLPNMNCQSRNQNLWNCWSTGWRSATPGLPNMSGQSRNQNLWNCPSMGGRSATPGLPNMSGQSRNQNLSNHHSRGVDLQVQCEVICRCNQT